MPTIEFKQECRSCKGTGLYVGMGERDGAAVVCHSCKGKGWNIFKHTYNEFEGKEPISNVKRVFEVNPGIFIGENEELSLEDFGGMPFEDWQEGKEFKPGMENRKFTCPAWWYQCADYDKKPDWDECELGSFSGCSHFKNKDKCWKRWDKEYPDIIERRRS